MLIPPTKLRGAKLLLSRRGRAIKVLVIEMSEGPTIAEVLLGIARANREEARLIQDALKARYNTLARDEATQFRIGMTVSFTHQNKEIEGVVEKINRKSINVNTPFGGWRISPSLLTVVE